MSRTNTIRAVLTIILWSVVVHLPGLHSPLLDYHAYRQCQTASMARNYYRHGMHFLSPEIVTWGPPQRAGTEFPIYSYALAGAYKLFGIHEILGRLLSMALAAWGAVFLYLFVRRRMGERIGLWSALVMCALPIHIYFTRTVQPEPMALWGLLGFLYYGDQWLSVNRNSWTWLCAVFLGALAPLLKLPYMYLLAPLWLFLGYERFGTGFLKNFAWMTVFFIILGASVAWYSYTKTALINFLPLSAQANWANLAPIFTRRLWEAQFVSRVPELVTTYSGLFFAVIGFYYFRNAKSFFSLCVGLLIGVLYVLLLGEYGLIHRYTLLPLSPIAAIWIACGLTTFWEHAKSHFLTGILAVVLIAGIPVHAALRIKAWYRLDYTYVLTARTSLDALGKASDLILVPSHEAPEILYYLDRYGFAMEPKDLSPRLAGTYLNSGIRFIFLPREENRQTLPQWASILKKRGRLVRQETEYLLYQIL